MATSVGLNFRLTAAVENFERSMSEVNKKLGQIDRSSQQAASGMRVLAGIEVGKTLIAGFSAVYNAANRLAGGISSSLSGLSDAADAMGKLATSTGLAHEPLQVLTRLADYGGVSAQAFGDAIQRMSRSLGDAQNGTGTAGRALERLGINLDQLLSLSPAEQFIRIASAIDRINDPTQKAATAAEIFGRSGVKLIPMFEGIEQSVADTSSEMLELGQVLSGTQIQNIEAMNDSFAKVKATASGILSQVLANFAPALTRANELVLEMIKNFTYDGAEGGQAIANMISDALIVGAKVLLDWAEAASNIFLAFASALMKAAELFLTFVAELASVADFIYLTLAPLTRALTGGVDISKDTIASIRELAAGAAAASESLWNTEADFSAMRATLDAMGESVKANAATIDDYSVKTTASTDTLSSWMETGLDSEAAMADLTATIKDLGDTSDVTKIDLSALGEEAIRFAQKQEAGRVAADLLGKAASSVSSMLSFLNDTGSFAAKAASSLTDGLFEILNPLGITKDKLLELANAAERAKTFRSKIFDNQMAEWDRVATQVRDRLIENGMNPFLANELMMQERAKVVTQLNGKLDLLEQEHLKNLGGMVTTTEKVKEGIGAAGEALGAGITEAATTASEWATGLFEGAADWLGDLFGGEDPDADAMPEAEQTLPELEAQTTRLDSILGELQTFGTRFTTATIG